MATILVTGGTGFLGRHLLAALRGSDEVIAVGRQAPGLPTADRFVALDLSRRDDVERVVADLRPDVVFHLAGCTPPSGAEALYRGNTLATIHLLGALRRVGRPARVVMAGSAAELGPVDPASLPVAEGHPCRPRDGYGLSKWFATLAGLRGGGPLRFVSARLFNLIGPGMPSSQAFGRFASRLATGLGSMQLTVGDMEARRDFLDARDAARALIALAEPRHPAGLYHVGTGVSLPIRAGLEELIRLSGREVEVEERDDAGYTGPRDSRADSSRLSAATGWLPSIPFERSLADLWEDARGRAGHASLPGPHMATRVALRVEARPTG